MNKNKFAAVFTALLLSSLLSSCITTTTGGFQVEASSEQALQDYIQLAIGYYDSGDLVSSRMHLANALAIDDQNSEAYNIQALIFQREGDLVLAEQSFLRAISLNRGNSRARNNYAALLFSTQRYEDACEELDQVSADTSYPGRAVVFENLGRCYARIEKTVEAVAAFNRALSLNNNLYVSAMELSMIYLEREDLDSARQHFQRYQTIVEVYNIPHTPRSLLAGIQIEGYFQNQELVENYSNILNTLYRDSPEFQQYQRLSNAN